jgi:RecA-family ATPase
MKIPTPKGFSHYVDPHSSEIFYFREGDPRIQHFPSLLRPWQDTRPAEEKAADQMAARAAYAQEQELKTRDFAAKARTANWKKLFHSKTELENAPPITFAIDGFLPEKGITMLGGRSGDGKTLLAMNMARCLLEGSPLFGHFASHESKRVVYLIPESGMTPFAARTKLFDLVRHAGDRFFCRTLDSQDPDAPLTDPAILKSCEGADVFLDTAVRFMEGEENSASDNRQFAKNLFALLRAGARTVTGLHHAPKQFERAT